MSHFSVSFLDALSREEYLQNMKLIRLILVSIAVIGTAFILSGCGRNAIATVNGQKIPKDEFYNRLERVNTQQGQAGIVVLNQLIQDQLWLQLAKDQKVEPTEAQIKSKIEWQKKAEDLAYTLRRQGLTLDDYKKLLIPQLAQFNVMTKGINIKDQDIRTAYDQAKNKDPFSRPARTRIAIIMSSSEKNINLSYDAIKNGADFGAVASRVSEDAVSRNNGGELGWIWKGMAVVPKAITDVATSLDANEVSKPFTVIADGKTQWYIIKALRKQPVLELTFEDSKDYIKDALLAKAATTSTKGQKLISEMFANAKIKVNSDKYKGLQQMFEKQQQDIKKAEAKAKKP
jgi:foldase protein PrsA